MENAGFERDEARACCSGGGGGGGGSSTVEMSEVQRLRDVPPRRALESPSTAVAMPLPSPALLPVNGNGSVSCSEYCQSLHLQHQKNYEAKGEQPAPESPWHHLKTIFLVGTIIFLALWILVYTLLSQFSLL